MNYILFDDKTWDQLMPLTFTRPVSEIRMGILTIKEKWEKYLQANCSNLTQKYLQEKFPIVLENDNIFINSSLIPTAELISEIDNLEMNQVLKKGDTVCALRTGKVDVVTFDPLNFQKGSILQTISDLIQINYPWDIFRMNGEGIEHDFKLITKGRKSQAISKTNNIIGDKDIFIERGAVVEFTTINAKNGPVYIGKGAEVMENSAIRGPFALCANSVVKMSSKIYGPTTIGPNSKVGGELNNVVFFGNSNKAHDGFLGNSVIGEWCNLGADTNSSNLKNNYAEVKLWSYQTDSFVKTGLQFCGLIMGDHSKCGINTMFNTGTVVGVGANIFGEGYPRNFIPSFTWGGAQKYVECRIETAYEIATRVMERRNLVFDEVEKKIMREVFDRTAKYRVNFQK